MQKIVLASGNLGKITEISALLQHLPLELLPQSDFNVPPAVESAFTFVENALIKARHASQWTGLPALSDDSGLCVSALNGAPGVLSARYAGESGNDLTRIHKVLADLAATGSSDRRAEFHSVMVFLRSPDDPTPLICQGCWRGTLLHEPRGYQGFGYDPIFYVTDYRCSAAELELSIKNIISHRGQAMQQLMSALSAYWGNMLDVCCAVD